MLDVLEKQRSSQEICYSIIIKGAITKTKNITVGHYSEHGEVQVKKIVLSDGGIGEFCNLSVSPPSCHFGNLEMDIIYYVMSIENVYLQYQRTFEGHHTS